MFTELTKLTISEGEATQKEKIKLLKLRTETGQSHALSLSLTPSLPPSLALPLFAVSHILAGLFRGKLPLGADLLARQRAAYLNFN